VQIILNGAERKISEGATVADLLAALEMKPQHVAVEVNLELVPRARHGEHRLAPGDRLEVVTLVGGG
jgi:thiamine biosynthesis protein ThiS